MVKADAVKGRKGPLPIAETIVVSRLRSQLTAKSTKGCKGTLQPAKDKRAE